MRSRTVSQSTEKMEDIPINLSSSGLEVPENQQELDVVDRRRSSSVGQVTPTDNNDTITSTRSRQLTFTRMAYDQVTFDQEFEKIRSEGRKSRLLQVPWNRSRRSLSGDGVADDDDDDLDDGLCCTFNKSCLKEKVKSLFPIWDWGRKYKFKEDGISDLMAGLTIIVFHVPQSMGYSLIAQVSPVFGLYTAFFPALIYSLMGTSRHAAIGLFAVISLMTGSLVSEVRQELATGSVGNSTDNDDVAIRVASAVSCVIGFYQLLFGILQMGFISVYLSEHLVSGFTSAASLYVLVSQLPFMVGRHLPHHSGPFSLIYSVVDIVTNVHESNVTTVILSTISCFVLLIFKISINESIARKWPGIIVPIELILVILGILSSTLFSLSSSHVDVVGEIPSGLPCPILPDLSLVILVVKRSIPLAIVAYTLTISVGKIFALRHGYAIDPNQELIALGVTNIVSCLFSCLPSAASLSRSAVQESAGGRTQLVSLVNCTGILVVLYFAGSLLAPLPVCILAAIISVALKSLFLQTRDFLRYWRVSKVDGSIWLVTFVSVVVLGVDLGLYVGLTYSLVTLIYKSQRPKTYILGSINRSDVYVPIRKYAQSERIDRMTIYQFCGALHFANIEYFRKDLVRKVGVSVPDVKKKLANKSGTSENSNLTGSTNQKGERVDLPTHVIIDCSMLSYIDTTGVSSLKATVQDYESIGIKTYLAGLATHVDRMLELDNFYRDIPPHHVYISVHDAVHHAQQDQLGIEDEDTESTYNCDVKNSKPKSIVGFFERTNSLPNQVNRNP